MTNVTSSAVNKCDFCKCAATHDTKTVMGPWAFVCQLHFDRYSTKQLGECTELKTVAPVGKICYLCNKTKPIDEFYKYTDSKGVERYRNECKECNLYERKKAHCRKK